MHQRHWIGSQERSWLLCESNLSIHLRHLELLTEVLTMSRLYWIGLYEDKWKSFIKVDLSPAFVYCAKCMLGESEHTQITGHVAQILTRTNERTYSPVATVLFQFAHLVLSAFPLFFLILYLYIWCFEAPPGVCIMLGVT